MLRLRSTYAQHDTVGGYSRLHVSKCDCPRVRALPAGCEPTMGVAFRPISELSALERAPGWDGDATSMRLIRTEMRRNEA